MSQTMCQLETIFCDDVRTESSGKKIYVGVYSSAMLVSKIPATLPALVILLRLLVTEDRFPRKSLRFVILSDDEPLFEHEPPMGEIESRKESVFENEGDIGHSIAIIGAQINIAPFQVKGPMKIRARAYIDGNEVRGAALLVRATELSVEAEVEQA